MASQEYKITTAERSNYKRVKKSYDCLENTLKNKDKQNLI